MATQLQQPPAGTDWKDRYRQVLLEFENNKKNWSETEAELYKSILRLIFSYTGLNPELDQDLSGVRDRLRKETSNHARNDIINPVIENIINFARQRDLEPKTDPHEHLMHLLDVLDLSDDYQQQLQVIGKTLGDNSEDSDIQSCIDQLAGVISEACKGENKEAGRIELKADDPLTQLLENLSLPGEPGIEMISLRKRAREIEEEQERLQLIQDLVQLLSGQNHGHGVTNTDIDNFPHFKDTILELFEWLAIPKEYNSRVENVKSQITNLQSDSDLSSALRETAVVINDLQATLQVELGDIQGFLAKVTSRLEEVEHCFFDMGNSESETLKETQHFNNDIENNVRHIREGIADSNDVSEIKKYIENRLVFIEKSVTGYLQSTQSRQRLWHNKINTLKKRINTMKGESTKLHKRILEEYRKAKTDTLTGVPNRLAYNERINYEFSRWQQSTQSLSICVIDVDKFKGVNDNYGHKAGDKVLKTIAEVCANNIREKDFFARYGGEEFVLLLPETALDEARLVADSLRHEIEICKFHYAKDPVAITISGGVSEFSKDDTTESVFIRADKALYTAKENGRNQVVTLN